MESQPTVKQITDAMTDLGEAEARRILGGKSPTQATPRELAELVRAAQDRRS